MNIMDKSILGKGPSFPLNMNTTGGLSYTDGIERINQSLFLLFETPKGSRLMMPGFGSDIHKYKFDPLDRLLMEKIRYTITQDISKWEPRISLTSIEFLADNAAIEQSILYVSINYNIISTTISANYVYPYRLSSYSSKELF